MPKKVTVVDYGLGNLLSVSRALSTCDADVHVTTDAKEIANAERLVLPGVGAFADGMAGLRERKLIDCVKEYANSGRPLLGICLGMQMFMATAEEFGHHEGLGLIEGTVSAIPNTTADGKPHKIPHIGWNSLHAAKHNGNGNGHTHDDASRDPILTSIKPESHFYFVHSFAVVPEDDTVRLADAFYNGRQITAMVKQRNLYGCQFHPEKSGAVGLQLLSNFVNLV